MIWGWVQYSVRYSAGERVDFLFLGKFYATKYVVPIHSKELFT